VIDLIGFIILGVLQGAIYGLLAIGIVVVYKGSKVFNFAQAEFGTLAAFLVYMLHSGTWKGFSPHLPYLVAVVLSLVIVAGFGFLMERLVVRPLFNAPKVTLLVATAGVALLMLATELLVTGVEGAQKLYDPLVAGNMRVLRQVVSYQQLVALLVLGTMAIGMAYFFNKTDYGLAVLALSQEPVATELTGIGAKRMSSFVWIFAAVLGGVAGVLQGGISNVITPGFMTVNYLILAFTAAVAGGISSLAGAFVGGMFIGVLSSIGQFLDTKVVNHAIPGLPGLMVFAALLVILLVKPSGLVGKEV
jgi:branched-chain amino acid transport system permease protein